MTTPGQKPEREEEPPTVARADARRATTQGHALAALQGLAIGDALGMPTQLLSREKIREVFGTIDGFEAARPDHPIAAGMRAGSVTDDTEQALLLAGRLIADGGHVDPLAFARDLALWEERMRARGSLDLLGPSTKAAVAALGAGVDPAEAGGHGTTNGAAMRVAPVGIAVPPEDLTVLVDRVAESAQITHNTGVALAGASAVAAAVSIGIDRAGARALGEAVQGAIEAARIGARRGHWIAGADVAARIGWAVEMADPADVDASLARIAALIGTSLATQESVPAAFGILAIFPGDPWSACRAAAALGGDTDTIAAIAGAIGGAVYGPVFPPEAVRTVERVNGLHLEAVCDGLLALRAGGNVPSPSGPRAPRPRLLAAGNAIVDLTMFVPALPERGGDVVASRWAAAVGGAFNVMAAAARQGMPVVYLGAHGTGPFGDRARRALRTEGIEALQRAEPGEDTGFSVAVTDEAGERTFLTTIGAEARLAAGSLDTIAARPGDLVYLSGYTLLREPNRGTVTRWLTTLPEGTAVLVDPGPLAAGLDTATLRLLEGRVAWWSCNEREARLLTGETDARLAAAALARRTRPPGASRTAGPETAGANATAASTGTRPSGGAAHGAVVRLGARGCLVCVAASEPVPVPAFPVTALDTNGAGDAHVGVFLASLAAGLAPRAAARRANAAAALAVTLRGPASAPDAATLDAFLRGQAFSEA